MKFTTRISLHFPATSLTYASLKSIYLDIYWRLKLKKFVTFLYFARCYCVVSWFNHDQTQWCNKVKVKEILRIPKICQSKGNFKIYLRFNIECSSQMMQCINYFSTLHYLLYKFRYLQLRISWSSSLYVRLNTILHRRLFYSVYCHWSYNYYQITAVI